MLHFPPVLLEKCDSDCLPELTVKRQQQNSSVLCTVPVVVSPTLQFHSVWMLYSCEVAFLSSGINAFGRQAASFSSTASPVFYHWEGHLHSVSAAPSLQSMAQECQLSSLTWHWWWTYKHRRTIRSTFSLLSSIPAVLHKHFSICHGRWRKISFGKGLSSSTQSLFTARCCSGLHLLKEQEMLLHQTWQNKHLIDAVGEHVHCSSGDFSQFQLCKKQNWCTVITNIFNQSITVYSAKFSGKCLAHQLRE